MGQHAGDVLHQGRKDVTHVKVRGNAKKRTFDLSGRGGESQAAGGVERQESGVRGQEALGALEAAEAAETAKA